MQHVAVTEPRRGDLPVPYSQEAEEAVIGSLLLDRDAIVKIAPYLKPEHFFFERLGQVYAAVYDLFTRRVPADFVTLAVEMQRRGWLPRGRVDVDYIACALVEFSQLVRATPTAVHVEYYAHIVADAAAQRGLITTGGTVAGLGYVTDRPVGDVLTEAVTLVQTVAARPSADGLQPLGVLFDRLYDDLLLTTLAPGTVTGVPTGLRWLDSLTGGLRGGNVYLLAARTKVGKTALALQWAMHAARTPHPDGGTYHVGYFSLEMSALQLGHRLLAAYTGLDLRRVATGAGLSTQDHARLLDATGVLAGWGLYLDAAPAVSITEALGRARYRHQTDRLDLIVVDYLQLFSSPQGRGGSREQEVAAVSRALVQFALEAQIPVVALAQLNRAAAQLGDDETPQPYHLRESGALEQDAAMVLFLTRTLEVGRDSDARLTVALNRHGPLGAVPLRFDGPTTTFHEVDTVHTPGGRA
jgi:replicative DNA helicase